MKLLLAVLALGSVAAYAGAPTITSVLNAADFGSHLCPGLGFKLVITFIALVRGGVKQNERELF